MCIVRRFGRRPLLALLSPNQSAIDRDNGSGHIVGQVGRKELATLAQSSTVPSRRRATNSARSRLLWLLPGMTVCRIRPVAITPEAVRLAVIPKGPRFYARYRV
jgi:hypothetical protein